MQICYPRLLGTFTHFHERSGTKFVIRMCKAMVTPSPLLVVYLYRRWCCAASPLYCIDGWSFANHWTKNNLNVLFQEWQKTCRRFFWTQKLSFWILQAWSWPPEAWVTQALPWEMQSRLFLFNFLELICKFKQIQWRSKFIKPVYIDRVSYFSSIPKTCFRYCHAKYRHFHQSQTICHFQ